jgi:hypothetical protein
MDLGGNLITLEPLRARGSASLFTLGIPGQPHFTLREIELIWKGELQETIIRAATDIFDCFTEEGVRYSPLPNYGTLTRAVVDMHFFGSPTVKTIELIPPKIVLLPPGCDPDVVRAWLSQGGFLIALPAAQLAHA